MFRTVIAITALALSAGAAFADVYTCHSITSAPRVTLDFTLTRADAGYVVSDAAFKIGDDVGYSTTATEPTALATITGLDMDNKVSFNFHQADVDVAAVRLVTRFDGAEGLATGTLQLPAGDVWAMRCDVTNAS